MTTALLIRIGVALLLAGLLWWQSRGLASQPHRRRAFRLGAGALLAFALFNATLTTSGDLGGLQGALALVGMVLFAGAALSLGLSLRAGERRRDREVMAAEVRAFTADRSGAGAESPETEAPKE